MNKRVLIAGLVAGVVAFLSGWVIFGMLLMDYMDAGLVHYEGLNRPDMNLGLIFLANVVFSLILTWVCDKSNSVGALPGFITGAVVGFGVYANLALMFMAMMNWYTGTTVAVVDVLASTVWSALTGAAAGWVLQRLKGQAQGA